MQRLFATARWDQDAVRDDLPRRDANSRPRTTVGRGNRTYRADSAVRDTDTDTDTDSLGPELLTRLT
jgi:hypothetical protein